MPEVTPRGRRWASKKKVSRVQRFPQYIIHRGNMDKGHWNAQSVHIYRGITVR